jgi:hypothetical protein
MLKKLWFGIILVNFILEAGIRIKKEKGRNTVKVFNLFLKSITIKASFLMVRKTAQES